MARPRGTPSDAPADDAADDDAKSAGGGDGDGDPRRGGEDRSGGGWKSPSGPPQMMWPTSPQRTQRQPVDALEASTKPFLYSIQGHL
mmetsp:Transcript_42529/g.121650  ORF Transcript_42529/g.121650 Transcript_42529/m.121650 type:complete len:87 (-) Transcript_42529:1257-1517(-)